MPIPAALLALAFTLARSSGQETEPPAHDPPFAAVFFADQPPEALLGRRLKLSGVRLGSIPVAEGRSLSLVWGTDATGSDRFWLHHVRSDVTSSLHSVSPSPAAHGALRAVVELSWKSDAPEQVSLELMVLPAHQALLYRWNGEAGTSPVPGGAPVARASAIRVGLPLPDLQLQTLEGAPLDLRWDREVVVVVNWWGVTCAPCIEEMPGLNDLATKYGHRSDVRFIAVTMDSRDDVRRFLETRPFLYEHTVPKSAGAAALGTAVPRNIVVSRDGKVTYDRSGALADEHHRIEAAIRAALGQADSRD